MIEILKNPKRAILFLFITAFIVRGTILLCFDHNIISPDGSGYHTIAVNIVKGNGFSNDKEAPFQKYYFREPGYPLFLASIYSIVNIFKPVEYINKYDQKSYKLDRYYPEIIAAKTVQVIIDSISIILIFLILLEISTFSIALYTSLISALFFNFAFHSVFLLRETLVMFLLLLFNLCYIKYVKNEFNKKWLIPLGSIIGLLMLIFQVHIVFLPVLFILILTKSKKIKKAIIHITIILIIAMIFLLPFSISVYQHFPDIRIFKTFGYSSTQEMAKYTTAINKLAYYGKISKKEASGLQDWNKSSEEQFAKSFNGFYESKADSINSLIKESFFSKRKIEIITTNFKKSFFLTKIGTNKGNVLIHKYGFLILIPLLLFPIIIGTFGLLGLFVYGRNYILYLPPLIVYISLFWILGSEYRRMIILQPFLIFFAIIFIKSLLLKFKAQR